MLPVVRGRKRPRVCKKRFAKIEVRASTLNLKFIGTSADVDFAQVRNFQSGFEYQSRSKTFLHSLGQNRT